MIEFGHGTHKGLERHVNEDVYIADMRLGLFLVADGMGGRKRGMKASALVRDSVCEQVRLGASLVESVHAAGRVVSEKCRFDEQAAYRLGSTVMALRINGVGYEAAWVGDSALFVRHGKLHRLSQAGSLPTTLYHQGIVATTDFSRRPAHEVNMQALGVTPDEDLQINQVTGKLLPGMCIMLCTDGLASRLPPPLIAQRLARTDLAAQEVADSLLLDVLDAGGNDNTTLIVLRYFNT